MVGAEREKFVAFGDLTEVLKSEAIGDFLKVPAVVAFGKMTDTETIGRVELIGEKFATDIDDALQLQQTRDAEQRLDVLLVHVDFRRVGEVDETFDCVRAHVTQGNARLTTLRQFAGEHRLEIGARRGENESMGDDFAIGDDENDVAEIVSGS